MRTTHISFAPNLTARAVVVSYDHNYGEYRARLADAPEADYFTDDPTDALAHAIQLRLDLGRQGVAILDEIDPTPAMRKALARHHDQQGDM